MSRFESWHWILSASCVLVLASSPAAQAKYRWSNSSTVRLGTAANHELEAYAELEDNNLVLTGVGFRVGSDDLTTLHLRVAPILADGTLGRSETFKYGSAPHHELETYLEVGTQEVIVGLGLRVGSDHMTTLKVYARELAPETGELGALKTYSDGYPNDSLGEHDLEVNWLPDQSVRTTLITGVGLRVGSDDVTTLRLKTSRLARETKQAKFCIRGSQEVRAGEASHHELEAMYTTLSDHLAVVGLGFRAGNDDVSTMVLLLAPILGDGTISDDVIRVSRGRAPEHELEVFYQCPPDRVVVGCGLRMGGDDLTTMSVHTRRLDPATGRLSDPRVERVGSAPHHELEVDQKPTEDLERTLLRGLGVRAGSDNVTTLRLVYGRLEPR